MTHRNIEMVKWKRLDEHGVMFCVMFAVGPTLRLIVVSPSCLCAVCEVTSVQMSTSPPRSLALPHPSKSLCRDSFRSVPRARHVQPCKSECLQFEQSNLQLVLGDFGGVQCTTSNFYIIVLKMKSGAFRLYSLI